MLKEAVDHFHKLLDDDGLRSDTVEELLLQLKEKDLFFGGRPLSPYLRPHFVLQSEWENVKAVSAIIWSAIQKVKEAAVSDSSLLDELGIMGIERELIKIDPGYSQVSPTARLDSFLTQDVFSYVELNGESPAGIAYSDVASEIFKSLPVVRKFAESFEFYTLSGRQRLLDVILHSYREFAGTSAKKNPSIAIVDLKDLPTQREFEMFQGFFRERGIEAVICSPHELEYRDRTLSFGDFGIDIVYKRLLVNEYIPIIDEAPALLNAYRERAVCMVNSFRSKLVHKKAIFSVLTDKRFSKLFTMDEVGSIEAHVPWTRLFRPSATFHRESKVDIVEWTRSNRGKLVLKPNDDYGGHGIFIGWTSSASQWDDAIDFALTNGDYLVQERVPTSKEIFPMLNPEGEVEMLEQLVDLDPFLFNGQVGSAFTRLSTSELANVSSGGGMVPTFIIAD